VTAQTSAIEAIRNEATEIEDEAAFAAIAHRVDSRKWQKLNLYMGGPATVLAAVAGVTAFSDLPDAVTGGTAMVVAALTATATWLGSADKASSHRTSSVSFSDIRRRANLLRDVDAVLMQSGDEAQLRALVDEVKALTAKLTETEQGADTLSTSSREKAKKEIASSHRSSKM
jgi:hypothetical protein